MLPSTDLFVLARHADHNVPRCVADANLFVDEGCNCSISSNNILNPFTPFGDGSLIRMANLHANILQIGQPERMAELFAMISERSARLMNLGDYGLKSRQSRRCRDHRCVHARDGGRHDCAGARRLQTRPPDGRSAARSAPASGLSR